MRTVRLVGRFIIIPFIVCSPHLKPSWPIISSCLCGVILYCFDQTALDEATLLGDLQPVYPSITYTTFSHSCNSLQLQKEKSGIAALDISTDELTEDELEDERNFAKAGMDTDQRGKVFSLVVHLFKVRLLLYTGN